MKNCNTYALLEPRLLCRRAEACVFFAYVTQRTSHRTTEQFKQGYPLDPRSRIYSPPHVKGKRKRTEFGFYSKTCSKYPIFCNPGIRVWSLWSQDPDYKSRVCGRIVWHKVHSMYCIYSKVACGPAKKTPQGMHMYTSECFQKTHRITNSFSIFRYHPIYCIYAQSHDTFYFKFFEV